MAAPSNKRWASKRNRYERESALTVCLCSAVRKTGQYQYYFITQHVKTYLETSNICFCTSNVSLRLSPTIPVNHCLLSRALLFILTAAWGLEMMSGGLNRKIFITRCRPPHETEHKMSIYYHIGYYSYTVLYYIILFVLIHLHKFDKLVKQIFDCCK